MNDRELDLLVADLQYENKQLRLQCNAAVEETIHLRHTLEQIHAKCVSAFRDNKPKSAGYDASSHDDKSAY